MMDITSLNIECSADGTKVTAWCKCHSPEDVDDLTEWLGLARQVMEGWENIRNRRAPPSPASGKNVTPIKRGDK